MAEHGRAWLTFPTRWGYTFTMLVVMQAHATEAEIRAVCERIQTPGG